MLVRPVDPRDTQWEIDEPSYRVHIWTPQPVDGWRCDSFELTDVDIDGVLEWADETVLSHQHFTLYASVMQAGRPGLIRLTPPEPKTPPAFEARRPSA